PSSAAATARATGSASQRRVPRRSSSCARPRPGRVPTRTRHSTRGGSRWDTLSFSPRETSRLILRAIEIDDSRAIHQYMSDPLVTSWLPEGVLNEEQADAFAIKNAGAKPEAFAVVTRDGNELIGHMVFHA